MNLLQRWVVLHAQFLPCVRGRCGNISRSLRTTACTSCQRSRWRSCPCQDQSGGRGSWARATSSVRNSKLQQITRRGCWRPRRTPRSRDPAACAARRPRPRPTHDTSCRSCPSGTWAGASSSPSHTRTHTATRHTTPRFPNSPGAGFVEGHVGQREDVSLELLQTRAQHNTTQLEGKHPHMTNTGCCVLMLCEELPLEVAIKLPLSVLVPRPMSSTAGVIWTSADGCNYFCWVFVFVFFILILTLCALDRCRPLESLWGNCDILHR